MSEHLQLRCPVCITWHMSRSFRMLRCGHVVCDDTLEQLSKAPCPTCPTCRARIRPTEPHPFYLDPRDVRVCRDNADAPPSSSRAGSPLPLHDDDEDEEDAVHRQARVCAQGIAKLTADAGSAALERTGAQMAEVAQAMPRNNTNLEELLRALATFLRLVVAPVFAQLADARALAREKDGTITNMTASLVKLQANLTSTTHKLTRAQSLLADALDAAAHLRPKYDALTAEHTRVTRTLTLIQDANIQRQKREKRLLKEKQDLQNELRALQDALADERERTANASLHVDDNDDGNNDKPLLTPPHDPEPPLVLLTDTTPVFRSGPTFASDWTLPRPDGARKRKRDTTTAPDPIRTDSRGRVRGAVHVAPRTKMTRYS